MRNKYRDPQHGRHHAQTVRSDQAWSACRFALSRRASNFIDFPLVRMTEPSVTAPGGSRFQPT